MPAAPVFRIYEAVSLVFPEGASMPQGATVDSPPCLLCRDRSHLPPAKAIWISAGGQEAIAVVCADCAWDCDDAELEKRIVEKVSEPVAAE